MFSLDIHCDDHEFKCLNNKCINKNLVCNGVDDCGENDSTKKDSDEENCLGICIELILGLFVKKLWIKFYY